MPRKLIGIALAAVLAVLSQGTWALAGTSGGLSGYTLLQDGSPLAGASVTASSPSEVQNTHSDSSGHFTFVSLTPDTYTVTASEDGYDTVSQAGITVIADNTQNVTLHTQRSAKVIAVIPVRAANELVRPGTTADVYSVNAATASKLGVLGGGGGSDNVYGAIASLPGATVGSGQYGWYQTVHIRGGDYDQVGYEYDGIPVNRSFDNYPTSTGSNTGSNELQVYTGAAPQNAEGQGLSGFINQVIKDGTYPGFANLDLGIGSPSLYNKLNLEIGGGTPSRNFTYYVATGGYNVRPRYLDNSNGAGISVNYGAPFDTTICPQKGINGSGGHAADSPATASNLDCFQIFQNLNNNSNAGAGPGLAITGPGGYALGSINTDFNYFQINDRENVVNLHFGLPHRGDSGRDDIQLLFSNSLLRSPYYSSFNDWGAPLFAADATNLDAECLSCVATALNGAGLVNTPWAGVGGTPFVPYVAGFSSTMPAGTVFTAACPAPCGIQRYQYPSSNIAYNSCDGTQPLGCRFDAPPAAAANLQDSSENGQGIYKLQYQHNIGSSAFFRVYAYSYYSWWYLYGIDTTNNGFVGCCPSDYELSTHTRGASAEFEDQINARNLITAQIAGITATTVRDNNTQMLNGLSGSRRRWFPLVSAADPYNGICYGGTVAVGNPFGSCQPDSVNPAQGRARFATDYGTMAGGLPDPNSLGISCNGPCAWLQAENGPFATYNNVKPTFYSASIGDQFKPSDKFLLNLGIRVDQFQFQGGNTNNGNITTFWLNAWNNGQCISAAPGSSPVDKMEDLATFPNTVAVLFGGGNQTITPMTPCTSINDPTNPGHTYLPATLLNPSAQKFTYTEFQPRIGGTYTADADNVIRFSFGKYVQAPNAAFEQYNSSQNNLPEFLGRRFLSIGFTTPGHQLGPESSYNTDLSWEHRFANSDVSFKLSPFYRHTDNQNQFFFLDQKTAFVSGLPIAKQTSEGVEFQLQKGDFNTNGFSGLLAYTYTWSYVQYGNLPGNGGNPFTSINNAIKTYNAYTSFCATNPTDPRCGVPNDFLTGAPCYTTAGNPDTACLATSVANPYWNAPVQNLFDPNGRYQPYSILPNGFNSSVTSFAVPNVGSLVLNWKHDKLSITPSIQYFGSGFYGAPLQTLGIDPATNLIPGNNFFYGEGFTGGCSGTLTSGFPDSRYPFGPPAVGTGGAPYDALTCNSAINIPDPYTGKFDTLGAFRTPQQLLGNLQVTFDATPRVSYVVSALNLVDTCWGGTKEPWTVAASNKACWYGLPGYAPLSYGGNFNNPDTTFQPLVQYPYQPYFGLTGGETTGNGAVAPVQLQFEVKVKL